MRFPRIAAAALLLLLPVAAPAMAWGAALQSAKTVFINYSAKTRKKPIKQPAKLKRDKVDYMRAVPMK
jgi:hypothetical protein